MPAITVALARHPLTPSDAVHHLAVRVRRAPADTLAFTFAVDGDLACVRIPPPARPRIAHGLWEHTCFEVFVALADDAAYHEINASPSGEWAAYAFASYRSPVGLADELSAPNIVARESAQRLEVDVLVALARLSPRYARTPLRLGLSAVIEETDGRLSYWALHHPPGRPDFHHRDALALQLEPPEAGC
jgi:hypothetical protein